VGPFVAIYLAGYKWNEESVGLALTVGGIAGILTQTPAGALVDFLRSKRALVGVAVAALAAGALLIARFRSFWPIMGAQILIGGTSSVFIPAICAMSLGIVGHAAFDTRQGRDQTFNSAGNVTAALSMGLLGYLVSNRSIFFFVVALAVPTILVLLLIRPAEIDYELARGANDGEKGGKAESVRVLFQDRPLVLFLVCAVMFHFANAAMLPLLGELLAKGRGRSSMLFMGACVVTTQFVITLIASWSGRKYDQVKRSADPDIPEPRIRGVCMIACGKGCFRQLSLSGLGHAPAPAPQATTSRSCVNHPMNSYSATRSTIFPRPCGAPPSIL